MSKLGYTWYPKDWNNSEAVFELTLQQRGLYRELIDLAMLNDNKIIIKSSVWVRKWNIPQKDLNNILTVLTDLDLVEINKDCLFIPSCESRLNLVRGGRNGGKKSKPIPKPIVKPTPKPTPKQKKEKRKEIESKEETIAERKQSFRQSLTDFNKDNLDKYPKQLFIDFEMYWTEHGPKDKKMKFEKQDSFGISQRLATWFKRDLDGTYKAKVKRLNTFD